MPAELPVPPIADAARNMPDAQANALPDALASAINWRTGAARYVELLAYARCGA